jgi:hypothetical protein
VTRYYARDTGAVNADSNGRIVHSYLDLNDRPCIPNVRIDENGFQVLQLPQEIEAEAAKAGLPTQ